MRVRIMTDRKSFVLHKDSLNVLDELTNEQAGKLFKAIKSIQLNEDFEVDCLTKIALAPFKAQFARDNEKYQKIVERNKNNGLKGGRPKTQENQEEPKKPSGLSGNPDKPKKADSVSVSVSVSDSDSDIKHIDQSKIDREKLIENSFNFWWNHYPKKLAKKAAFKSWQKTTKKMDEQTIRDLTNHIVDDVEHRLKSLKSGSDEFLGFDRLHPTTYLNQERYNDDYNTSNDQVAKSYHQQQIDRSNAALAEWDRKNNPDYRG